MANFAAASITSMVRGSTSTPDLRSKQREEREAEERRQVTEESFQKTAELAREGISVRDFETEALAMAKAERIRRADAYQALRKERKEDEDDDEKIRAFLKREEEEEEVKQVKRRKEESATRGSGGGDGECGEPMEVD